MSNTMKFSRMQEEHGAFASPRSNQMSKILI